MTTFFAMLARLTVSGVATTPIVGAYDYGSSGALQFESLWARLAISIVIAAMIAALGEGTMLLMAKLRRRRVR